MEKWIDAEAAVDAVKRSEALVRAFGFHNAIEAIREVPAADVAPVRRGTWSVAIGYDPKRVVMCSECQRMAYEPSAFCPHCGAKMDGGDGE